MANHYCTRIRLPVRCKRAMDETSRRRERQVAYNRENNITPIGINKSVTDVMDIGYGDSKGTRLRKLGKVADKAAGYEKLNAKQLTAKLKKLENTMYEHARNLEFEEAARVRDEISELKEQYFKGNVTALE